MIGLGVWCAAGTLATASAESASLRLASAAPWWVFVLAVALASAVPVWRRSPATAAPALLATVPWWPVPLPAIALIWTGPLAWLPVAAAVIAGPVFEGARRLAAWPMSLRPRTASALAAAATLAASLATAWGVAPRLPGGDEPHYLIITQSLLADGDLRIENNHAARDYAAYFGGDLAPDFLARGRDGEIYSIHAPGISALVAPAFRLFGYRGAQAVVILLAMMTGLLVWRVGWDATGDAGAAWFAWAAVVGSATFLIQSVTIFPDGPGALVVIAACWLLVRLEAAAAHPAAMPGRAALLTVGGLLAALPWLHTRFVVLAAGFGLAVVWAILRESPGAFRERLPRLAAFLGIPVASAMAWFAFFFVIYGTPSPTAPYGPNPETSWMFIPGGLLGLLTDQQFGLLATAPVLALAVWGLARGQAIGARRWAGVIVVVYLAVVATYWMWWAGRPASPARFAAAALPALTLPLAAAWARLTAGGRAIALALLTSSLALTATLMLVGRGALLWNDRTGNAAWLDWAGPVVDLPRGLPSFFWTLDPARLATEWPFAGHVAVALALIVLSAWGLVRFSQSGTPSSLRARLTTVWWCLLVLPAVVQSGWWMHGLEGLDPARSQLRVIADEAGGSVPLRIGPFAVRRTSVTRRMTLRPERTGRLDPGGALGALASVPAGQYEVIAEGDAQPLAARLGRMREPWLTVDQAAILDLPAGARSISFNTDSAAAQTPGPSLVGVRLLALYAPISTAVSAARLGGVTVFFTDDNVFVEPTGFWIRGGRTASFVVSGLRASEDLVLALRNGAVANEVGVDVDGRRQTMSLLAGVIELVTVTAGDDGRVEVTIASASGFRPNEVDGGGDTRFLGVWVGLERR